MGGTLRRSLAIFVVLTLVLLPGGALARSLDPTVLFSKTWMMSGQLTVHTVHTVRATDSGIETFVTDEGLTVYVHFGFVTVRESWVRSSSTMPYVVTGFTVSISGSASGSGSVQLPGVVDWAMQMQPVSPMDVFRSATAGLQTVADGRSVAHFVGFDGTCQTEHYTPRWTIPYGNTAVGDDYLGLPMEAGSHVVTAGSGNERVMSTWEWTLIWYPIPCSVVMYSPVCQTAVGPDG
jgi:hypothetical protein